MIIAYWLEDVAGVAWGQEQPARVVRLCGAAAALRDAIGGQRAPSERVSYEGAIMAARTALGDDAFTSNWAAGRAMSLEQALAEALGDAHPT